MINFLVYTLAIWRITSFLTVETGPYSIFYKLRTYLEDRIKTLECFWCTSVYVSLPFAILLTDGLNIVIYTLALSALAIIINEVL